MPCFLKVFLKYNQWLRIYFAHSTAKPTQMYKKHYCSAERRRYIKKWSRRWQREASQRCTGAEAAGGPSALQRLVSRKGLWVNNREDTNHTHSHTPRHLMDTSLCLLSASFKNYKPDLCGLREAYRWKMRPIWTSKWLSTYFSPEQKKLFRLRAAETKAQHLSSKEKQAHGSM